ncbi:hypothetical protein [Hymenobacter sp.]|uniref:hypothetical protein n=1 Tax=Hymenobacter sp. TaxID=1898978 RepID=UPI00286ADBF9|nr:hypothetical protein [Hymenobacter sp.]
MKHVFFTLFAGFALVSCSEINTDPAPARLTRTVQTATLTYSLSRSTLAGDTVLVNPRLQVFTYPVTLDADGKATTPNATGTLLTTITDFSAPQPIVLSPMPVTITDGVTGPLGVRFVLTSANRPGRRTAAQRLNASFLVDGAPRATATLQGTSFSRTAPVPASGVFTATNSSNIGG